MYEMLFVTDWVINMASSRNCNSVFAELCGILHCSNELCPAKNELQADETSVSRCFRGGHVDRQITNIHSFLRKNLHSFCGRNIHFIPVCNN
jgi:hypothetical protein